MESAIYVSDCKLRHAFNKDVSLTTKSQPSLTNSLTLTPCFFLFKDYETKTEQ